MNKANTENSLIQANDDEMNIAYNPKVSIIIPVFNGENFLKEAINSAVNQTYKNLEIIVVNDGSTDRTEEISLSYGDKIKYYRKENGGVSTALNFGISKMTGDFFSWLSHDDIYDKNKIKYQIKYLSKLKYKNFVIGCNQLLFDNDSRIIYNKKYYFNNYKSQNALFCLFKSYTNGCDLLVPKYFFIKYGLFNTELKTTQDYDMWFRILRYENLYAVSKYLVYSRLHDKQTSNTDRDTYLNECSELWIDFDKKLSVDEKKVIFGNEYSFYMEIYKNLKNSHYNDALSYYKNKILYLSRNMSDKDKLGISDNFVEHHNIMRYYHKIKLFIKDYGIIFTSKKIVHKLIDCLLNELFYHFKLVYIVSKLRRLYVQE